MKDLRDKLSAKISSLDDQIKEDRRQRAIEKNQNKWPEYDRRISDREMRRKKFQETLDNLGNKTEQEWNAFKAEVRDLFDRDARNDSTGWQ